MSLGELGQGISGDDVTTDQLHWRIVIGDLLTEDGTRKHRVEPEMKCFAMKDVYLLRIMFYLQS